VNTATLSPTLPTLWMKRCLRAMDRQEYSGSTGLTTSQYNPKSTVLVIPEGQVMHPDKGDVASDFCYFAATFLDITQLSVGSRGLDSRTVPRC
jgi:hypothetical protein